MNLLVLNYEYPPLGGGAGNATYFLAREWAKAGHTVSIITTGFKGYPCKEKGLHGEIIYRLSLGRKRKESSTLFEMLKYVLCAFAYIYIQKKRESYDQCISFFALPTGIVASMLKVCRKIPYIILLRGGDVPGFLNKELHLYHTLTAPITKYIWKKASRVIANSTGLKDLAQKTATQHNVLVEKIPNGVDTQFFMPSSISRFKKTFLFVGRFVPQKNCSAILNAFMHFTKNNSAEALMLFVGDGPLGKKLQHEARALDPQEQYVKIMGWQDKETLKQLYQQAFCFVNPSSEEGMSNTMLEAMACGLPLITSNVSGNNEVCTQNVNGIYSELLNSSALQEAFRYMWFDADWQTMGKQSRSIAETEFSWSASAKRIIS